MITQGFNQVEYNFKNRKLEFLFSEGMKNILEIHFK